jgi:hypothetical protein
MGRIRHSAITPTGRDNERANWIFRGIKLSGTKIETLPSTDHISDGVLVIHIVDNSRWFYRVLERSDPSGMCHLPLMTGTGGMRQTLHLHKRSDKRENSEKKKKKKEKTERSKSCLFSHYGTWHALQMSLL